MARFITLASSSSGNAAYIGDGTCGVLIDAGISAKRIKTALSEAGVDPSSVHALFVTHEHTDHVAGLRVLAGQLKIPVYATRGTLAGLSDLQLLDGKFPCTPMLSEPVTVGDMRITSFRTHHDSRESCGYVVRLPDRTVGICTDTGKFTKEMGRALAGCDLVLLESNYDREMLINGYYPPYLKGRILSDSGHLSNDDCAEAACVLYDLGVHRFVLGHLSRENNTPDRAVSCTRAALKRLGAKEGEDYVLTAAPVEAMEAYMVF
jgi:phosphoribosyl 1,2-cyclic phosphodiesterase